MIRVFARKTSMTPPADDLVFFDGPPLFDLPDLPVYVSVTFTWDIGRGKRLASCWRDRFRNVFLNGPAFGNFTEGDFVPGRFLKSGITITSRGCPKTCPWCLVSKREGKLREINIAPGHIVQDNNLLACSRGHIERVFEMLSEQSRVIQFKGGLDIDYLETWHIDLMKQIKIGQDSIWVACDKEQDLKRLDKARDLFGDYDIGSRRCYVLVGFDGDTPDAAQRRCEKIYDQERGFLPFAQYYQPGLTKKRLVSAEWQSVVRKWSRPAAYRPNIRIKGETNDRTNRTTQRQKVRESLYAAIRRRTKGTDKCRQEESFRSRT